MNILDGKTTSATIRKELQKRVASFPRPPHLVVIYAHPHPSSTIYVRNKIKACEEVGIHITVCDTPYDKEQPLLDLIHIYNQMDQIDGILVQLPIHPSINPNTIVQAIRPEKDVDGAHPHNLGKLLLSDPTGFCPCTPLGIQTLLTRYNIHIPGKHVVIVGRSISVGKPLAMLLAQSTPYANATVSIAHRATHNLQELCLSADILVAAAGSPKLITEEMVRPGAVVIDVGITSYNNTIVGDVDFEHVAPKTSWISPVPGGVGPMTIVSLLENTIKSYEQSLSR